MRRKMHRVELAPTTAGVLLLAGVYLSAIVTCNAIAAKLWDFGLGPFTVGTLAYPLTFVLQDVVSERYGQSTSRQFVWAGFAASAVMVAFTQLALALPEAPRPSLPPGCYAACFATTPRIVAGSLVAFVVGGLVDVRVFFAVRARTGERAFWLRKLASTAVSQAVDTVLFVVVAFAGELPLSVLLPMVGAQYVFKLGVAVVDTPLSYLMLRWLR